MVFILGSEYRFLIGQFKNKQHSEQANQILRTLLLWWKSKYSNKNVKSSQTC